MLFIINAHFRGNAQYNPQIDTIEVIPTHPSVSDNVSIHIDFTINSYGQKLYDSLSFKNDTAHIYAAFLKDFSQAFLTFQDTFKVGNLPAGLYFIEVKGYYDLNTGNDTIHTDSTYTLDSFQVYDDIGLKEMNLSNSVRLELFPNPSSGKQQIDLYTQIPAPLQISLHDVSGQKVMEVYNGLSVQGEQEFDVDLSQLPQGLYLYHIKVGEEWEYVKTVKK